MMIVTMIIMMRNKQDEERKKVPLIKSEVTQDTSCVNGSVTDKSK